MLRYFRHAILLVITTIFTFNIAAPPVYAVTYIVTNLNDNGSGSLRQAILDANSTRDNDIITFNVNGAIDLTSGELVINSAVTAGSLIIQGNENIFIGRNSTTSFRLFTIASGADVMLSGLTITNGNAQEGGAIFNEGRLTLDTSILLSNTASTTVPGSRAYGGGIYNAGTLSVTDSIIIANGASGTGALGGAVYNTGRFAITSSRILYNTAPRGGAIYTDSSERPLSITNSCIVENSDTTVFNAGENPINATGIWWGTPSGPYIGDAPVGTGSSVSVGDSINGTGEPTSLVNVGLLDLPADYGTLNTLPNGNWLTTAPPLCPVCSSVPGTGRVCQFPEETQLS